MRKTLGFIIFKKKYLCSAQTIILNADEYSNVTFSNFMDTIKQFYEEGEIKREI